MRDGVKLVDCVSSMHNALLRFPGLQTPAWDPQLHPTTGRVNAGELGFKVILSRMFSGRSGIDATTQHIKINQFDPEFLKPKLWKFWSGACIRDSMVDGKSLQKALQTEFHNRFEEHERKAEER